MCRVGKIIIKCLVGAHAHKEHSTTILRDAIILGVQHSPLHSIARYPVAGQLIAQQVPILAKYHSIDVFDYESLWEHLAQHAVEFTVKIISVVSLPLPLAALRVALAGITAHQKICRWKLGEVANVSAFDFGVGYVFFVGVAGGLPDIVCPDDVAAKSLQRVVGATASAE